MGGSQTRGLIDGVDYAWPFPLPLIRRYHLLIYAAAALLLFAVSSRTIDAGVAPSGEVVVLGPYSCIALSPCSPARLWAG